MRKHCNHLIFVHLDHRTMAEEHDEYKYINDN